VTAGTRRRRLVIVVRADPVICGHSGEARNIAEVARHRGFDEVRIVTWPIDVLQSSGLPLKPLDSVLPYGDGIVVERPEPVGDYKVPDARYYAGLVGRLVELFTDGVPTVCMSLYLMPHTLAVHEALAVARATGLPVDVTTIAEAVGSDITNVVRHSVEEQLFGAAAQVFAAYLSSDVCVAVSAFTKRLIVESAVAIDVRHGTRFADQCQERIAVSYPAIDSRAFTDLDPCETADALDRRGLGHGGYALFLSRVTKAKGVDDLIDGYAASHARHRVRLVIAGTGPESAALRARAASSSAADRITFLDDVDDDEKRHLMAACAAYVLPSKPRPEFVETFGIALVEQLLSGGGPVITTSTGGIPEAIGDHGVVVPVGDPVAIAKALDDAVVHSSPADHARRAADARTHALQFDRVNVFDRLFARLGAEIADDVPNAV
jgi:glycosyltransferase involved in cell wall biosynthesis